MRVPASAGSHAGRNARHALSAEARRSTVTHPGVRAGEDKTATPVRSSNGSGIRGRRANCVAPHARPMASDRGGDDLNHPKHNLQLHKKPTHNRQKSGRADSDPCVGGTDERPSVGQVSTASRGIQRTTRLGGVRCLQQLVRHRRVFDQILPRLVGAILDKLLHLYHSVGNPPHRAMRAISARRRVRWGGVGRVTAQTVKATHTRTCHTRTGPRNMRCYAQRYAQGRSE